MFSSEGSGTAGFMTVRDRVARCDGVSDLSREDLRWLLATTAKEYARRQQEDDRFALLGAEQAAVGLTATDAVIVASALLDALDVEIFELGMWKTWGVA